MNTDIINIEKCLTNEEVTATFQKYKKQYSETQLDLKLPQFRLKQLETQYAYKNISLEYQRLFENETKRIVQSIANYQKNNPDDFTVYILNHYKVIKGLFDSNYLTKPPPINILEVQVNSNHFKHIMHRIKHQLQNSFVVPTLNFIENNYLHLLLEENVFPSQIKTMFSAIGDDKLLLKDLQSSIDEKSQYAVFSQLNNHLYYLEYNSFTNLISYRTYLNESYLQFVDYLNNTNQIIQNPKKRILFYNKIKTKIECTLDLFAMIPTARTIKHVPLPNFIRKDTLAELKQYINDSFIPGQEIVFRPSLGDFQDLQYCIGKKALLHIESKIKTLQFALKIDRKGSVKPKEQGTELSTNIKIKTGLTVNQIVFFVRCIYEEKGILNEPNKMALFRKLTSIVSSVRQEKPLLASFKNKYYTFDDKVVDFWIEKFTHFLQFAKKLREKSLT
ncbi:MAG: hypothetical protein HQ521_06460 [Bacteroidetes bacterium]|nr:hypothetical protein [Bacteroidota bacterium]